MKKSIYVLVVIVVMAVLIVATALVFRGSRKLDRHVEDFDWAKSAGGGFDDRGKGIAVDSSGNSYLIGTFSDTAYFAETVHGDTLIVPATGFKYPDIFIASYNKEGKVRWAQKVGGFDADNGCAVAADRAGTINLTGSIKGEAYFEFGKAKLKSAGSQDIFIAQYDSLGRLRWATAAGGVENDEGTSIAVDGVGNNVITGFFHGTAKFGAGTPRPVTLKSAGKSDIFVAKYDASGKLLWAKRAGGVEADTGKGIAIDRIGNCYVTGVFSGQARFDTTKLTSSGTDDIFVVKYDAYGKLLWAKQAGGRSHDCGASIAVDETDNCYVTGTISDTVRFVNEVLLPNDVFIAKYDPSGNQSWAKRAGGPSNDHAESIVFDVSSGTCYVTGVFSDSAWFGGVKLSAEGSDIFLARYDNKTGYLLWASQGGKKGMKQGVRIALQKSGRGFLTGQFSGDEATFGRKMLTSTGSSDVFVATIAAIGARPTKLKVSRRPNLKMLLTWKNNATADPEVEIEVTRIKTDSPGVDFGVVATRKARLQFHLDDRGLELNKNYSYEVNIKGHPELVSETVIEKMDTLMSMAQHTKDGHDPKDWLEVDDKAGGDNGWSYLDFNGVNQIYRGHLQIWIKGEDTTKVFDGDYDENHKDFDDSPGIALWRNSLTGRAKGSAHEHTAAPSAPELPVIMKCKGEDIEIKQFTYKNNNQSWVLAEWNVRNTNSTSAKDIKLALFLDADVAGRQWRENRGGFIDSLKLVYLFQDAIDSTKSVHVGLALISEVRYDYQISKFDSVVTPTNSGDPRRGEQARLDLFAGRNTGILSRGPSDLAMTLVSNLGTIAPGDSAKVIYAVAVAENRGKLIESIRDARKFAPCASPSYWADLNWNGKVDDDEIKEIAKRVRNNGGLVGGGTIESDCARREGHVTLADLQAASDRVITRK
ncbi:SBBP repeat-containing protein [candidate division KSB1 bacterium]|nr:SBBP repeat-containing protein [candidate division KSB1 bacterium]